MERTLLLSPMYEPVATISWRKAITLLVLSKVEVMEQYERQVRSPTLAVRLPSVVRLIHRFRRRQQRVRFSKQNLFARDRWTCQYCGRLQPIDRLTQDHVVPRALGGKTCWENVVTACVDCNSKKADRTVEQAGLRLRRAPRRPEWVPLLLVQLGEDAPTAWRTYCASF